jgi:hypothetical protein
MPSTTLDLAHRPAPVQAAPPQNLAGLTRAELAAALAACGVVAPDKARMRASQLWRWIHHYGVVEFDRMSDISKEMRARLAEHFIVARPEVLERQVSRDGTRNPVRAWRGGGDRLHSRRRPFGRALRLQPGRLHPELHFLPYGHSGAGP